MQYRLLSLSHHTAPIELRECLALPGERLHAAYADLRLSARAECMLLSTCNRLEILSHGLDASEELALLAQLADSAGLAYEDLLAAARRFDGNAAVRHAFRVASGLDSMVLGEPQILGQWKEAFQLAVDSGMVGSFMQRLGQRTLQVAKRVRSQTDIGRFALNLAAVAVELAEEIFEPLDSKDVLVLGAGEMAELAVTHFRSRGIRNLTIVNRTYGRAADLAGRHSAMAQPWEQWPEAFRSADIVLVGAGTAGRIWTAEQVRDALRGGNRRARMVIDLAVPRAVDPAVARLPELFLYSVDDLEQISAANRARRSRAADEAEQLIEESVDRFVEWYGGQTIAPTMADLMQVLDDLRQVELERSLRRSPDHGSRDLVDRATAAIVRRIQRRVAVALRDSEHEALASLVRALSREIAEHEQELETG